MKENQGKFVVVYGMNNLGKTTASQMAVDSLEKLGLKSQYLKYPIYDLEPTGPRINRYLRENNPEDLSSEEAQRVFALNRRDYEPILRRKLEDNDVIMAEDYRRTTSIWGLIYDVPLVRCEEMNADLMAEDLAILLDGERFNSGIESSHKHEQREDWPRGRKICLDLAKRYGWKIVNANQGKEKVAEDIVKLVKAELHK